MAIATELDNIWSRNQFPSLALEFNGQPAVYLDGPGGTQVPKRVIDAMSAYLMQSNANTGGAFPTSQQTDESIAGARQAMADFLACNADEIVFGPNMTNLAFAISRSIGRDLRRGDQIVVTQLDHSANISPWQALEELGVEIRYVEIRKDDCTLDMDDLARKIGLRTRLVAVGYASNAVGSINDVREIVRLSHAVRAMVFVDAVHYAPHGLIDVQALGCDFLTCSTYKFFGPHAGVLYGRREQLDRLRPYKVRPLSDESPNRYEMGTLNHEGLAGVTACVDYIAELGQRLNPSTLSRRSAIIAAFDAIRGYERVLVGRLIEGLLRVPRLKLYGITEKSCFDRRCPTVAFRIEGHSPAELAMKLARRGIFVWHGNCFALNLTERLDVEKSGGFLRVGLMHYNNMWEVEKFLSVLRETVAS
jgi:cysteine desulfurase family protein (TIGR01976 family)